AFARFGGNMEALSALSHVRFGKNSYCVFGDKLLRVFVLFFRRTVEQGESNFGFARRAFGATDAFRFHLVVRDAQARRVGQNDGIAAKIKMHLYTVARGSRFVGNNSDIAPCKRVDETRLSCVRRADNGDANTIAQPLSTPVIVKM